MVLVPSLWAACKGASPAKLGIVPASPEPGAAEGGCLKSCEAQQEARQLPVRVIVYRLRFVFGLIWLTTLQYGSIAPSVIYISTSFFAGGGADCSATPDSDLCKRGAADLAFWAGLSGGISHAAAWVLALTLGSWSDRYGRRPLLRAKALFSVLPVAALFLHVALGASLWGFLVMSPLYDTFDINGVFLAFMSDVVEEPHARTAAFGVLVVGFIIGVAPVLPLGALLPAGAAVVLSLVAAGIKLVYMFTIFPETSSHIHGSNRPSITEVARQALRVFGRNAFIFRMVLVLVLSGISLAGLGAVALPILTAYLGMKREASTLLAFVGGVSVIVSMVGLLPRLMASLGPVRSLRLCLAVTAAYPVLFGFCTDGSQVTLLSALLIGPMFLQIPLISAIKMNLVKEDEQGLVQGALAAVKVIAVAVADVFFGWFYRFATASGRAPREATFLPLGVTALIASLALAIACTLSNKPPPPPRRVHFQETPMVVTLSSLTSVVSSESGSGSRPVASSEKAEEEEEEEESSCSASSSSSKSEEAAEGQTTRALGEEEEAEEAKGEAKEEESGPRTTQGTSITPTVFPLCCYPWVGLRAQRRAREQFEPYPCLPAV